MRNRVNLHCAIVALVAVILALVPQEARMAINPDLYREHSPEWLTLLILEATATRAGKAETFRILARVVEVERSKAKLVPGDEIEIVYDRDDDVLAEVRTWNERAREEGFVGEPPDHAPTPPTVGTEVRAYLAPKLGAGARVFQPDAAHHSFE